MFLCCFCSIMTHQRCARGKGVIWILPNFSPEIKNQFSHKVAVYASTHFPDLNSPVISICFFLCCFLLFLIFYSLLSAFWTVEDSISFLLYLCTLPNEAGFCDIQFISHWGFFFFLYPFFSLPRLFFILRLTGLSCHFDSKHFTQGIKPTYPS